MERSPWQTESYARRYDEIVRGDYPFHQRAAVRLVEFAAPQAGQAVLDLGAGTGLVAAEVLRRRPSRLTLLDSSRAMLTVAAPHLFRGGYPSGVDLQFVEGNADRLTETFGATRFDLVIASYAFGWFPDRQRVFHEVANVLTPGGTLVFDVPPPPEPPPQFLATAPVFQVFSQEFGKLLRQPLGYAPGAGRTRTSPPDYAGYVRMAQAAGFSVVETLRVDVTYSVREVEAAWRYGWWFSAAANPSLVKLDPVKVEAVVEDAIAVTRASAEYAAWRAPGGVLSETYAALKVRKA